MRSLLDEAAATNPDGWAEGYDAGYQRARAFHGTEQAAITTAIKGLREVLSGVPERAVVVRRGIEKVIDGLTEAEGDA